MALVDDLGSLASLWGSAVSAWSDPALRSRPGGAVQYLWGAYNNAVGAGYIDPVPGAFGLMNQLSSAAAKVAGSTIRLQEAIGQVQAGAPDIAITAAHWAKDIDHNGVAVSPFEGTARVRVQADVTAGGIGLSQWFTWRPGLDMPQTVGGLIDALGTVLQGFGEDYGLDSIDLGGVVSVTVA